MKNNYEASEVFELGNVFLVIRGSKPVASDVESIMGPGYRLYPDPDDIDEQDD